MLEEKKRDRGRGRGGMENFLVRSKFPLVSSPPLPTIMGIEWGWFTSLSLESHGSKVKP